MKRLNPPPPAKPETGARRIHVTVVSVNHLPKMDSFGSCDPFCRLEFCGQIHTTEVKKGSYDAEFHESFILDVQDNPKTLTPLTITVLDWDVASTPDEV
jgi:Ca2+-dependent lipid-binding protein